MFGYINISRDGLSQERQERFRAYYCGLCHTLKSRYGQLSRFTLSYDMTVLYLLLTALYEPEGREAEAKCLPHPMKPHLTVLNEFADYCADMNLLLCYHKLLDDVHDEGSLAARGREKLFRENYRKLAVLYPETSRLVETVLSDLGQKERDGTLTADEGANATARILGTIYAPRQDEWTEPLIRIGEGLGRFIYLMDAYDDLDEDIRKHRFNPLIEMSHQPDFEEAIREVLRMMVADAAAAFEVLPIVQDIDILRDILYTGCWGRYSLRYQERAKKSGTLREITKGGAGKESGT